MAALGDDRQLGAGDQLLVALAVGGGDDPVAGTPHHKRGYLDSTEPARQLRIVEVRVPGDPRDGRAGPRLDDQSLWRGRRRGGGLARIVPGKLSHPLWRYYEDVRHRRLVEPEPGGVEEHQAAQ